MVQKLKLVKPPKTQEEKFYLYTRRALQFLYEENIRNQNIGVSTILHEAITYCDAVMKGKSTPDTKFQDAELCVKFIKGFLSLYEKDKLRLINTLCNIEINKI
jgi:hypothetical protein